ncbi:hypothetical protein RJ641_007527, partial [Dillenia turbinata]
MASHAISTVWVVVTLLPLATGGGEDQVISTQVRLDVLEDGFIMQDIDEVQKLVFTVDNISSVLSVEQKANTLEAFGRGQDPVHLNQSTFPVLEVDEIGLGTSTNFYLKDELATLLHSIEPEWTQGINMELDSKELSSSVNIDIQHHFSEHFLSMQPLEAQSVCQKDFWVEDLISTLEVSLLPGQDVSSPLLLNPVLFQEFQILDSDISPFQPFSDLQITRELEICSQISWEEMNFRNFDDLIVGHELALADDTFKAFPIPFLDDCEQTTSLYVIVEDVLSQLEPQPPSSSDNIYLDWHLLEENNYNCNQLSTHLNLLEAMDTYSLEHLKSIDTRLIILDVVFYGDSCSGPISEEGKESLTITSGGQFLISGNLNGAPLCNLSGVGYQKTGKGDSLAQHNARKAFGLHESSRFDDLYYFQNSREAAVQSNESATCWDIKVHRIKLSNDILALIENLNRCYSDIMKNNEDLKRACCSYAAENESKFQKQKLVECLKEKRKNGIPSFHGDKNGNMLVTLWAIQKMAWHLCFYGMDATCLYLDKLCENTDFLNSTTVNLRSMIADVHSEAEKVMTGSHPSLSVIQEILCLKSCQSSSKILIIAEKAFWGAVRKLLASMKISLNELQSESCCSAEIIKDMVSSSFPFNEFGTILEYGGSCGSSKVSTLRPMTAGLPQLHFVKVELEEGSVPKTLCEVPCPVPYMSCAAESEEIQPSKIHFADTVIIVNTQNFDMDSIILRRSTYQKILDLEKEGAQVVERDLNLPVDVIINAASCLAWYNSKNIGLKTSASNEASSCIPLCMEDVATNVLMLLSYSFSSCFLVFEGESSFLAAIMESSDGLYAAAAALGIGLQVFCSYSSEFTEEIILNCISYTSKLTRVVYPRMPESETLAESFLTKFPSINPLSAHAILSSGCPLVEFFKHSHELRMQTVNKYLVQEESVSLFSALCRYGEREESKSGMTDCSSILSPALGSEKCPDINDSGRKKQRNAISPDKGDVAMNHQFPMEPFYQCAYGDLNSSRVSKSYGSCMLKGSEILSEIQQENQSLSNELLVQEKEYILDWDDINSENLPVNFAGEVIDLTDGSLVPEDGHLFSMKTCREHNYLVPGTKRGPPEQRTKAIRRLSFGKSTLPSFPLTSKINNDSSIWNSGKGLKKSWEEIDELNDANSATKIVVLKQQEKQLEEKLMSKYLGEFCDLQSKEKSMSQFGRTPLSKAIQSAQVQEGSPWTKEFLNRMREKSKLLHQSLPHESSPQYSGCSARKSNVTKRKSPSILELYMYQGCSWSNKMNDRKEQKQNAHTARSYNSKNASASLLPTWTPIDKRAKKTLSFTSNGNGSQCKLVWNEGNTGGLKRFRNGSRFGGS